MHKYTIFLEENLSEDEVQRVLDAIFLLRGIKKIEKVEDEFPADISQSVKTNSSSPDFVPPKNISPQSQPFVAQISPNQINPNQANSIPEHISPENADSQRKIISEALRWGIHNQKHLEEIPKKILDGIKIHFAETIWTALKIVLLRISATNSK